MISGTLKSKNSRVRLERRRARSRRPAMKPLLAVFDYRALPNDEAGLSIYPEVGFIVVDIAVRWSWVDRRRPLARNPGLERLHE